MKYQKKPVVIEAWQFTKENFSKGTPKWIEHIGRERNQSVKLWSLHGGKTFGGEIKTLEGVMKVSENDYIIRGIHGEFYPCKPDIFEETYEPVKMKRNKNIVGSLINSLV